MRERVAANWQCLALPSTSSALSLWPEKVKAVIVVMTHELTVVIMDDLEPFNHELLCNESAELLASFPHLFTPQVGPKRLKEGIRGQGRGIRTDSTLASIVGSLVACRVSWSGRLGLTLGAEGTPEEGTLASQSWAGVPGWHSRRHCACLES